MRMFRGDTSGRDTFGQDAGGGAAVEAGILLPVLILLGFGAADASLLYQQTHRMEAGLTAGGSYLAAGSASAPDQWAARHVAVSGEPVPGAQTRIEGWSAEDVSIAIRYQDASDTTSYRNNGDVRIARLSASVPFRGIGLLRGMSGGSLRVSGSYETRLAR